MKNLTIAGIRVALFLLFPYWIVLFVGTHIPSPELPDVEDIDKIIHALAYLGLSFLMVWAIPRRVLPSIWRYVLAGVICVTYASVDELTQIPVGRTADWHDWYADCFGILLGLILFSIARKIYKVQRNRRRVAELATTT